MNMKNLFKQALLWIRDRFSLLFTVVFRLRVGGIKKENPVGSNPDLLEEDQNGKGIIEHEN